MSYAADQLNEEGGELSAGNRRGMLALVVAFALAIRAHRIGWGLPDFIFLDTKVHFVTVAARAAALGDWVLDRFVHPPLYPYLVSIATLAWSALTGNEIHLYGKLARADNATIVLIGRWMTVAIAGLLVAAVYLLGKRLLNARAGLWSAAFFALSPVHVIESHRINVDTPMLLLSILAAHQAVVAVQEHKREHLLASFALAAAAGATKYSGLSAGTLPLWAALTWPGSDWRQRLTLTALGGIVSLVAFTACIAPAFLNWDRFAFESYSTLYFAALTGAPGQDLSSGAWAFSPYVYLALIGLPFLLGWPIFLTSLGGLAALTRRKAALAPVLAGTLPYFLVQGAAATALPRYYLPLAPWLAIAAAAFVDFSTTHSRAAGRILGILLLTYTATLAISLTNQIGGSPQRIVGRALDDLETVKRVRSSRLPAGKDRRLVIGYQSPNVFSYDSVKPHVRNRANYKLRRVVFFPEEIRHPGAAIASDAALRQDLAWVDKYGIDAILVSSRWENARVRGSFRGREEQLYENIVEGRLHMRELVSVQPSFFTQSWYLWADPSLGTIWTAGIGGYRLFARSDLLGNSS